MKYQTMFADNRVLYEPDVTLLPEDATVIKSVYESNSISHMSDNKVKTIDKSKITNVTVNGNDNQVVTGSKNTRIDNAKGAKTSPHWLQVLYWIVGILVALITIYKFFIE